MMLSDPGNDNQASSNNQTDMPNKDIGSRDNMLDDGLSALEPDSERQAP